jgi:hypothetical protein
MLIGQLPQIVEKAALGPCGANLTRPFSTRSAAGSFDYDDEVESVAPLVPNSESSQRGR